MHIHDFAESAAHAVNTRNVEAILELWAEPADYDSPLTGPQHGIQALRLREEALFAGFSDLRATITPLGQEADTGALLVRFDGTHDGNYVGVPPTGRTVVIEMAAIVTFNDAGQVTAERVIVDTAAVAAKLAPPPAG